MQWTASCSLRRSPFVWESSAAAAASCRFSCAILSSTVVWSSRSLRSVLLTLFLTFTSCLLTRVIELAAGIAVG